MFARLFWQHPAAAHSWQWAVRAFGVAKQVKKLRLTGVVKQAYQEQPPPKLPKQAVKSYVQDLKRHGAQKAKAIVAQRQGQQDPFALTSEEKTRLLARYLPEEEDASKKLRKNSHKWLWRFMRRRDFGRFEACLDAMQNRGIAFDEVTYNFAMYGVLLNKKQDDELARQVLLDMEEEGRFHPALLRLQRGFLESYFELKAVEATPNRWNLLKVTRTFWQISVNFKRKRVKDTRAGLAAAASEQRARLAASGELVEAPWLAEASDDELSDEDPGPRVKFPARRPRQLMNVFKGSGVPNRRKHRWKH